MKHILLAFTFVFFMFGCHTSDKKIVKLSSKSIVKDSVFPLKKPKMNITKDFVLGKFNYKNHSAFIKIDSKYSSKVIYLQKKVYNAFLDMVNSAKEDNIELKIISGTRNFEEQKVIWNSKWEKNKNLEPLQCALKILEYSSMPSTSRHHWGTDLDLNSLNNLYFNSGKGRKEYEWLTANANNFGFFQVYTEKGNHRTGYNLEKWHWSFLPLASTYLEFYNKNVLSNDINDFEGFEQAKKVNIIENYVNGISVKSKKYKE